MTHFFNTLGFQFLNLPYILFFSFSRGNDDELVLHTIRTT